MELPRERRFAPSLEQQIDHCDRLHQLRTKRVLERRVGRDFILGDEDPKHGGRALPPPRSPEPLAQGRN